MRQYGLWLDEWKKTAALFGDPGEQAVAEEVSRTYSQSGLNAAISRKIEMHKQLAKRQYFDPADIAYSYASLGDKEQTFAWLDKALAEKSGALQSIKVVPALDKWHSDPRYVEVLKKMGLTP
jgi:hypothetical protein